MAMTEREKLTTTELIAELKKRGMSLEDIILAVFNEADPKTENLQKEENLEEKISGILRKVGIPAHLKGYRFLKEAILLAVKSPSSMDAVTKEMYPAIAKKFSTTPSRVERAIRHAIEVGWERGDGDFIQSFFGWTIDLKRGKPTNSEFIAMIVENL